MRFEYWVRNTFELTLKDLIMNLLKRYVRATEY